MCVLHCGGLCIGVIKDKLLSADNELKTLRKSGEPQSKVPAFTTPTPHTPHAHTQVIVDRQARQLEGYMSTYTELLENERSATQQNPLDSGATSPFHSTAPTGGEGLY